ncbi:predicted protein [Arabidopsis lyrata subsp. lyrata]|uniref:Predicted protein n=1 Tax=Arabidopsis lyrata subsp. lyrata TaxID=81972 RepID=D7MU37_ARALL|nr:predicted protein [Arabidopsis lyrata subsp. lyrata]
MASKSALHHYTKQFMDTKTSLTKGFADVKKLGVQTSPPAISQFLYEDLIKDIEYVKNNMVQSGDLSNLSKQIKGEDYIIVSRIWRGGSKCCGRSSKHS